MNVLEKIVASEARPLIDGLILSKVPSSEIVDQVIEKYGTIFDIKAIEQYRQSVINGPEHINQIVKVTQDLGNRELPPTDELSKLSMNFSFQKTNEDLEMLYDRIRKLKKLADDNPDDPTYDRRIKEYMAQAEAIRTRVFRHQYEQIRQAVLMTIGKKITTAAISVLMPYINKEYKPEAMRRFQAAIEPLLELKTPDPIPSDISDSTTI